MKNTFKETDVLLKEVGGIQLSGDDLVLYEHNKKSPLACLFYWIFGFGLHRFYLGDNFSKIYGVYFTIVDFLVAVLFYNAFHKMPITSWHIVVGIVILITWLLLVLDLFLIIPLIKYNNLILKKNILSKVIIRDSGTYRLQEILSIFALLIAIAVRIFDIIYF